MPKPFKQVTVVGAGTLGVQIALLAANADYRVNVFDQQAGAFDGMIKNCEQTFRPSRLFRLLPMISGRYAGD